MNPTPSSNTGNDAADGRSINTPFKTLGRALTVAKAGPRPATVVLRAGTYEEGAAAGGSTGPYTINSSYSLHAVVGDRKVRLAKGFAELVDVLWLKRAFEERLGLPDRPIDEELG